MRIGVIGTGAIVGEFLEAVGQANDVECTVICSRKEENAKIFAEKFGMKKIYTDYNLMLCDRNINFIYIALPNSLHYEYTLKALQKGKNVICEKPFTQTLKETTTLIELAKQKELFLFEAITTLHLPNYKSIKEDLKNIGDLKIIECNFSQYSSRYDLFKQGELPNVFNAKFAGGALSDINIYNLHFVIGLFGKPNDFKYYPNIEKGIDTSGILILQYDTFKAICIGAKDCVSDPHINIQGDKGNINVVGSANSIKDYRFILKTKEPVIKNYQPFDNRMVYEIKAFKEICDNKNYEFCYELLEHSKLVIEIAEKARTNSGIKFPADV